MRLCIGTAKGIVILDPARGPAPLMVLADPVSVWCMAQDCDDPGLLYAGSVHNPQVGSACGKSSLARSADGGRSWTDITPGVAHDEEIWALEAPPESPGVLFAGTSHARILKTENCGHTFRECTGFLKMAGHNRWSAPPPARIPRVRAFACDPHHPGTLYAGVEEGGVFRSRDGGESFKSLNHGIHAGVHGITADPEIAERLYATTGRGLYISDNGGVAWKQVSDLSRPYAIPIVVRPGAHGAIYAAAASGSPPLWSVRTEGADAIIYRSADRGRSFKPLLTIDGVTNPMRGMLMRLRPVPGSDNTLFGVLTDGKVIRIDERNETVTTIAEKLPPAYDLAIIP